MTEKRTDEELVAKLEAFMKGGKATIFTEEEVKELRNMMKVYRGLSALGWVGSSIRNIILIIMTIVGGYVALSGALANWIKGLGGP